MKSWVREVIPTMPAGNVLKERAISCLAITSWRGRDHISYWFSTLITDVIVLFKETFSIDAYIHGAP
jgi:hypothetical protein